MKRFTYRRQNVVIEADKLGHESEGCQGPGHSLSQWWLRMMQQSVLKAKTRLKAGGCNLIVALYWCCKYVLSKCCHTSLFGGVRHFSPYTPEVALGQEEKGLRVRGNLKNLGNYSIIFYVVDPALFDVEWRKSLKHTLKLQMLHSQALDLSEAFHVLKTVRRCYLHAGSLATIAYKISLGHGAVVSLAFSSWTIFAKMLFAHLWL